jgi:hypothetical protein
MNTRRSFLSSILIASCAPAIVKAENIAKIFVPKTNITDLYIPSDKNWVKANKPIELHFGLNRQITSYGPIVRPSDKVYFNINGKNYCIIKNWH